MRLICVQCRLRRNRILLAQSSSSYIFHNVGHGSDQFVGNRYLASTIPSLLFQPSLTQPLGAAMLDLPPSREDFGGGQLLVLLVATCASRSSRSLASLAPAHLPTTAVQQCSSTRYLGSTTVLPYTGYPARAGYTGYCNAPRYCTAFGENGRTRAN